MNDIVEIMNMIDWNMPVEIQAQGREKAKKLHSVSPFLQPLTSKYNKNVWDNCAIIISDKSDQEIRPYLIDIMEWVQDMNWPGAFSIFDRILKYSDYNSIQNAFNVCIEKAKEINDDTWEINLKELQDKYHHQRKYHQRTVL